VASALGLLASDPSAESVRTQVMDESDADPREIERVFAALEAEAAAELGAGEGEALGVARAVDVQYLGQAHALTVPVPDGALAEHGVASIARAFQARYRESYGIDLARPTQLVNFRVRLTRVVAKLELVARRGRVEDGADSARSARIGERSAFFVERGDFAPTPVYAWQRLAPHARIAGPAIVEGLDTTLVIPPRWSAQIDAYGNALLETGAAEG
jgi:N-methylhydantoinase A